MQKNRIVILGAGESGVGAALLAQANDYDVFVSDNGALKASYRDELRGSKILFEENGHSADRILAAEIIKAVTPAEAEPDAHKFEHSIEVQVPFIQHLFPEAKIVPVIVPPATFAVQLGYDVAQCIKKTTDKKIVCIGSTDLTHYGPRYGFCPKGTGPDAINWAKDVNDRQFIDLALNMKAEDVLTTSMERENACGCGAAAATVAMAKTLGKTKGLLLAHTHSNEVMQQKFNRTSDESVGYAAIVF